MDVAVSIVLAVRYVAKYRPKIRRKGLEATKVCGLVRAGRAASARHGRSDRPVAALFTIDLRSSVTLPTRALDNLPVNHTDDGCHKRRCRCCRARICSKSQSKVGSVPSSSSVCLRSFADCCWEQFLWRRQYIFCYFHWLRRLLPASPRLIHLTDSRLL